MNHDRRLRDVEAEPDDRPINLSERKSVTMPLLVLLGIVTTTATGALGYARLKQSDDRQSTDATQWSKRVEDHEVRLRAIENAQERMINDIGWIRRTMEEDRRRKD